MTLSAAVAAITPGDAQSVETKAFATADTATVAINTTAKGLTAVPITITANHLDSVASGDTVWIKILRTDTSMTGDAIIVRGSLAYSAT